MHQWFNKYQMIINIWISSMLCLNYILMIGGVNYYSRVMAHACITRSSQYVPTQVTFFLFRNVTS